MTCPDKGAMVGASFVHRAGLIRGNPLPTLAFSANLRYDTLRNNKKEGLL